MALIRWQKPEVNMWSPFRQMSVLSDELDRLFDLPLNGNASGWLPPLDLYADGEQLVLKAELPGMKKEDINIALEGDVLTLSGERKEEEGYDKAETHRSERFLGRFQRTLTLPYAINSAKVQASYKDGVLTVTLPKAEEAKAKQIEVKVD
jgi:HSP20 family protein